MDLRFLPTLRKRFKHVWVHMSVRNYVLIALQIYVFRQNVLKTEPNVLKRLITLLDQVAHVITVVHILTEPKCA
jgi:hypothetical protein